MAGVTEEEASVMVGATPEVIRGTTKTWIAWPSQNGRSSGAWEVQMHRSLRAGCTAGENCVIDD
jgi:hypothetical protein